MARLFSVNKIPVTLEKITHESELRRGEHRVKIAVLHCTIALTRKYAAAMPDGVLRRLYASTGEDVDPMTLRHDFPSLCDRQILTVAATPDSDPTKALDQVRIYGVYAKRGTTDRAFTLHFKGSFGPLSSKEWEFLDLWRTTQRVVNFEASQHSIEFDLADEADDDAEEDDGADDGKGEQPGLKLVTGTCTHGSRLGESCSDCDGGVAIAPDTESSPEPARHLPRRHAGGKKPNGPRRPTTH